jgi:hypothetical protein
MQKSNDLKVFISSRESKCGECGEDLGTHAWITLQGEKGALCLSCGDLDHLVYLPSGDSTVTRRAKKHSRLSAVVLKWSRARKRYERQGLLVEDEALQLAEKECEEDKEQREKNRIRAAERREELDEQFIVSFSNRIRELYPNCPAGREKTIARHACLKYSGRVGRSASAKALDENAVYLAVRAHIRHTETTYDELLMRGVDRREAREAVECLQDEIIDMWRKQ